MSLMDDLTRELSTPGAAGQPPDGWAELVLVAELFGHQLVYQQMGLRLKTGGPWWVCCARCAENCFTTNEHFADAYLRECDP